MKITSMETVSTGLLDNNKENYLRSKDKAEKAYDVLRHIQTVSFSIFSIEWPYVFEN